MVYATVYLCANGAECIETLAQLHDTSKVELRPTLILIDTPRDAQLAQATRVSRDLSPRSKFLSSDSQDDGSVKDLYGIGLLEKIVYETHLRSLSKLVVPIPVVRFHSLQNPLAIDGTDEELLQAAHPGYLAGSRDSSNNALSGRALLRKCLDSGAVDVMASPLHAKTLTTLEVHAYRAHKEAVKDQHSLLEIRRGRKRSWVGVHEEQPFAYLREAMVSGLMGGICRLGEESESRISAVRIDVSSKRRVEIEEAPGRWHFSAPRFDDDSLLFVATLIFKHALAMPELEHWRLPTGKQRSTMSVCVT